MKRTSTKTPTQARTTLFSNLSDRLKQAREFLGVLISKPSNMLLSRRLRKQIKLTRRNIFRANLSANRANLGANIEMLEGRAMLATLFDSFSDGNFTASPTWGGSTTAWGIQANSDAAAGATGSNTLRLASTAVSQTVYLSSQISSWGDSQEWGVWIGRRAQAFSNSNQAYFWLVANESNVTSATVDGYRLAIGDDTGNDEIRLEYIVNNAVSATVITSSGSISNGLTDIGFLARVTRSSSGAWQLFTSTLPTASSQGAIATAVPDSTNANVSQGSVTNNSLVPSSNNFVGVAALHSTGGSAIISTEFDQIYFTPTVANPTITGSATANAFTTTYGTASATQTFPVSGANLTANLVATAPAGFEVSSDGTTYASTATFIQTGGSASGTLSVRLAATAVPGGTYNSQNITLTSTGATTVNIATASSGNTVNLKALTVTGLTGVSRSYNGLTGATASGTASLNGIVGSDDVTITGTPVFSFASPGVANGKSITTTGYTLGGTNASFYTLTQPTLTADITQASLTVTANNVTKVQGTTLSTTTGSTDFTSSGLQNSESIGSVTITYGTGADAGATAATYTGQVIPSAAVNGTFTAANYAITYVPGDLIVSASPVISASGTLSAVNTTYGTASATPTSFSVSAGFLTGDLAVSAPFGFEVSTDAGSGYGTSLTLTQSGGTVSSTTIYVRLAATTAAGTYSGNVSIAGGGATTVNVATASSTVAQKNLTITGLTGTSKTYDRSATASFTGTASITGVVGSDDVTLSGTPVATYANANIGTAKTITVTGYTLSGTAVGNYTLTQPSLSADITALALTVTGAIVTSRPYAPGNTTATITGATLVGVISPDVVNIATSTGTFATADAGTGISVTAALTLGGGDAGNYTITQPSGLTGDITQASQTITFGALAGQTTATTSFTLTATATSGLTVTYTSSNPLVATVSGNTVTIIGIGTTTITASQAGDSNYLAATPVAQSLNVTAPIVTLAQFNFPATNSLVVSTKDANVTVSNVSLSTSPTDTIETNVTTGAYFPNEPYIEESGGWTATSQSTAKNFFFTVTAAAGYVFDITNIRFNAYATGAGPSAIGFAVGSTNVFSIDAPDGGVTNTVIGVNQSVSGQTGLTTAVIRVQGWSNGSRTSSGSGSFRLDDIIVSATVTAVPTITSAGTLSAVNTTYGTASPTPTSFTVSGSSLTGSLTVAPPSGYEVSTTVGSGYTTSLILAPTSGTLANTTVYARLAATTTPLASPYSGNITISGGGAASKTVATVASTVSAKALTVTGLTGVSRSYNGLTDATASGTASLNGIVGSDDVTITGTPVFSFASPGVANGKSITTTGYTLGGTNASFYTLTQPTLTADITQASLTVTANNVTKVQGTTLSTTTGSTDFTSSGLQNSESIGSVTITYGTGADAGATAATYTGQVIPSAAVNGTFTAANYAITYVPGDLIVSASPVISASGTLSAVNTTYGTASATPTSFSVSAGFLTGDLAVSAPFGFEVSTDAGSGYGTSLTLTQSGGTVSSTTIYVRLAATTAAGTYSGNVSIAGGGATTVNVATASSTVAQKNLTITGLTGTSKTYDRSATASFTGTASITGVVGSDDVTLSGTPVATYANANIGTAKTITVTGYTLSGTAVGNYTLTQPSLSADITALALTVTGAIVTSRPYAPGNTTATITGATLVGVISPDVVNIATSTGTFATADAGTGISVTAALTLGGGDAGNYTITQPTGLTGDITQASQTITFGALAGQTTATTSFTLTATATSGLTVTYTSSNLLVATVSGNTVTIIGIGTTTITASQAGDSNYSAATPVAQSLTVTAAPTVLTAGDLAIIAVGPSTTDKLAAVFLRAVTAGTVVNFTDNGFASATTGSTIEGFLTYTAPSDLPAGTVVTWIAGQSIAGTGWSSAAPAGFALSASGEQLFAFQGPTANWATQAGITLIDGFNLETTWLTTGSNDASTSYQPSSISSSLLNQFPTTSDVRLAALTLSDSGTNILNHLAAALNYTAGTTSFTMPAYTPFTILQTQTITFGTLAIKTYGDATFDLTATASSGLTVTYVSSNTNVATVSGSTVTIVGAGTTTITASQAGNSTTFAAATPVPQTLLVNQKTLTITGLTANDKTFDGNNTATLTGTATLGGVLGGDTSNVILGGTPVATFASTGPGMGIAVTVSGYSISGSAEGNYLLSQPTGLTANILAATVTTVDAPDAIYTGSAYVTPTFTVTSGGSPVSGASVTYAYAGTGGTTYNSATAPINVGTYSVVASFAGLTGFASSQSSAVPFSIAPKALTIGAPSLANKVYNGSAAAGSLTIGTLSGLVNSEDVTVTGTAGDYGSAIVGSYSSAITYVLATGSAPASNYSLATGSATGSIIPKAATITASPKSKVYGSADPDLTFVATGLVDGETQASVATGALTRVDGEDFGSYAIQQGDVSLGDNYSITYVGDSLSITKAPATVTADVQTKVYGDDDPELTYVATGFVNGDSESIITGALTRVAGESVGSYAIQQGTLSLGSNYDVTYVNANLSISKAQAIIIADPKSKVYGSADPAFTFVAYDLVNGDTQAGVATGTLTRVPGANVGTYGIEIGSASLGGNYNVTYFGDNLTVTPKAATVTADPKSKSVGSADPALTFVATGLVNGDTQGSVATGSLTRVAGETVGTYAIEQGSLLLGSNYSITYVGANFTITAASTVPAVSGPVIINGGQAQRSQVTSLQFTFNTPVRLDTGAVGIINTGLLTALSTPLSLLASQIVISPASGLSTTFTVTFNTLNSVAAGLISGSVVNRGTAGNSLADGNYQLTLDPTKVKNGSDVPMAAGYSFGTAFADNFFRMYGDSNGDGRVDGTDLGAIRRAVAINAAYASMFDWDGNGSVSIGVDTTNFSSNQNRRRRVF